MIDKTSQIKMDTISRRSFVPCHPALRCAYVVLRNKKGVFSMRFISHLLVMSIAFTSLALAQSRPAESLAATPPMGWNSWNWFAGKVTDKDIRQAADLIVSSGMR